MSFIPKILLAYSILVYCKNFRVNSRPPVNIRWKCAVLNATSPAISSNPAAFFKILPYIPDCLRNTCIVKHFLLIHNRGLPFNSKSSKLLLAGSPPPYPTREWLLPMTRWHGAKIEIAFAPLAAATARDSFRQIELFCQLTV